MPLQNRVDPQGDIHAVEWRGMFTGNRGIIHDPSTRMLLRRRWSTKAWIICLCDFKGLRREPMGRNSRSGNAGWTELFFLDEVTALASGHRPCFYCRRDRALTFLSRYARAFGRPRARSGEIDRRLHGERRASAHSLAPAIIGAEALDDLPDGAMVSAGERFWAKRGKYLHGWSFAGYREVLDRRRPPAGEIVLLTPATTVAVLRAGYAPVWHPTIDA